MVVESLAYRCGDICDQRALELDDHVLLFFGAGDIVHAVCRALLLRQS